MELCVLGPLEARRDGRPVALGGTKQRALLAVLLLHAGEVVSTDRLVDELWGEAPPPTAAHTVQVFVSRLRKALGDVGGRKLLVTRPPGYAAELEPGELDLDRFERLAEEGREALAAGDPAAAAARLREALALWRGPALADFAFEPFAQPAIARLEELRLAALADRVDAELALGRHEALVGELEALVVEHPLRERLRGQLMLALYRSGRQADALEAFQAARRALVEGLGIEPGEGLRRLERAILVHDPGLEPPAAAPAAGGTAAAPSGEERTRSILVAGAGDALDPLVPLARLLAASSPPHELVLVRVVPPEDAAALAATSAGLEEARRALLEDGVSARAAAFTSRRPGPDLVRLAADETVDLLLVAAPGQLLATGAADGDLAAVLAEAPCDVCLVAGGAAGEPPGPERPVLVAFGGAEHDWAVLELGAWAGQAAGAPLRVLGTAAGGADGRDASRLLAVASLALQRLVGIAVEPVLAAPGSASVLQEAERAALVAVGLPERWRHEGVGAARLEVAAGAAVPVLLVRRGLRPSGLAPPATLTRFTWSLAAAGEEA